MLLKTISKTKDSAAALVTASCLLSSLIITILILVLSRMLPPKIPLFYSLPWGDKQLSSLPQLLIIPAAIAFIALINLVIYWQLHDSQILFKRILLSVSIISSLILVISFIKIVFIFL